jgi:hypothetical protein
VTSTGDLERVFTSNDVVLSTVGPFIRLSGISFRTGRARTNIVTLRAKPARWTAACPAELAPPTTKTSSSRQANASVIAEPQ